jgi:hypothetical protein
VPDGVVYLAFVKFRKLPQQLVLHVKVSVPTFALPLIGGLSPIKVVKRRIPEDGFVHVTAAPPATQSEPVSSKLGKS